jgi:hypothetical protein
MFGVGGPGGLKGLNSNWPVSRVYVRQDAFAHRQSFRSGAEPLRAGVTRQFHPRQVSQTFPLRIWGKLGTQPEGIMELGRKSTAVLRRRICHNW